MLEACCPDITFPVRLFSLGVDVLPPTHVCQAAQEIQQDAAELVQPQQLIEVTVPSNFLNNVLVLYCHFWCHSIS